MSGFFAPKTKPSLPVAAPAPIPARPIPASTLSRFDQAVRYALMNEDGKVWDKDDGCFTNDPRDPGGATMWGIILTEYELYLGKHLTPADVRLMTRETAVEIYRKKFWTVIRGEEYRFDSCAICILDVAVNKGLGGCMVILSSVSGKHYARRYGDDVIADVNSFLVATDFIKKFEAATEAYIEQRVSDFPKMKWAEGGWMNRARRYLGLK